MKKTLIKSVWFFIAIFALTFFVGKAGFAQSLNTPYPIIFVHGTCSDNTTWGSQDGQFDNIVDYLEGAGLKFGGNLNFSLNYLRDSTHFNTTKVQDVHWYGTSAGFGDFYTINFNVRATPNVTDINKQAVIDQISGINITIDLTNNQIPVTPISQFLINDILRIGNEFMQVTAINGSNLTVKRNIIGTLASNHSSGDPIYNLSNESNQASIVKQGYALKIAIDAILQTTKAKKVILVGHSMGGLAAREYIKTYANNNVAKIVTIGTPHYGTNVTDLPNTVINSFLPGLDERSEAVRDLRTSINGYLGTYLFGGNESNITGYYSSDVDCNGLETDVINGLNSSTGYASLNNIAHTWIASNYVYVPLLGYNDAVVLTKNEYISSNDTLMTNKRHDFETSDYYTILRGLDEPNDPALAYEIGQNSTTKGFITFGHYNDPADVDLFKIIINNKSLLTINIGANNYTGIQKINLLDANQKPITGTSNINVPINAILSSGTYYIQIFGLATNGVNASYNYPYTLTTTTTVIPPP